MLLVSALCHPTLCRLKLDLPGHFFFTKLLIPALIAGKETSPDHHSRIVTTSSGAAYGYTLDFDTFKDSPARRRMMTNTLYSQSKFVRIHFLTV